MASRTINGRNLKQLWEAADQAGYDSMWTSDHLYAILTDPAEPAFEGWATLAALSQQTTRARIGSLVNCNGFRGARDEACRIVKGMLVEGRSTFHGKYYEVIDAVCSPRPLQSPRPPLMIAGQGEKVLLKIVAQHADMWNTQGSPERMKNLIERMRVHGDKIGRDTDEIEKTVAIVLCYQANRQLEGTSSTTRGSPGANLLARGAQANDDRWPAGVPRQDRALRQRRCDAFHLRLDAPN